VSIPVGDLALLRTLPHTSKLYLVIQQAQYQTGGVWTGYDWSCRINGAHTADPIVTLTVDGGGGAVDLLDSMTVLVSGVGYGGWDHGIYYLRGDQTVGPATVALTIGASSEARGLVEDDDYVVVLDEVRFWQRYGRIEIVADEPVWYKDYDIQWTDLGGTDAIRRAAMMRPVPIMGPHGVKFVEVGSDTAQFYFDWSDSYAIAPGEAITDWVSVGETDHAGGTWNSVAQVPGWQTVNAISGLRGFRVNLQVDDGNANAAIEHYSRGIRYVFTLRRPGETQPGDPPNAEPIVDFELAEPVSARFDQGHWRTSITVFDSAASKYEIMPGALVVLFTEDAYGSTAGSLGPVYDRENILLVGRIVDGTIRTDPETGDVTFDVASPGAEATLYHDYPVVVNNNDAADDWIETPDLTIDRAIHYYTTWHTNVKMIADWYEIGDDKEVLAQDFLEGDIYSTLDRFMAERLYARLLCDKYGRFHCEIDANERAFGATTTLWTMQAGDWVDEVTVRHRYPTPVNSVECWGLIYDEGAVIPKRSEAPGVYDAYRGARATSTSLAIASQDGLNTTTGRRFESLNHEYEIDFALAGNWRYCDIAPQRVVDIGTLATKRESLTGDYIIRAVTNEYDPTAGAIFTAIQTEQEAGDGVAGATVDIPDELPPPTRKMPKRPVSPGLPPLPGWPVADGGRRIIATDEGVFVTDNIGANPPVWYGANNGFSTANDLEVWDIKRDPFHWWTSGGTERTLWAVNSSGVWKHENFPNGTWVQVVSRADLAVEFGGGPDAGALLLYARISCSIETDDLQAVSCVTKDWTAGFGSPVSAWRAWQYVVTGGAIQNMFLAFATNDQAGYGNVMFAPHGAGQVIYAASNRAPAHVASSQGILWKSVNQGGAWANVDSHGPGDRGRLCSISIPYVDAGNADLHVLWGRGGHLAGAPSEYRVSHDAGATFADIPSATSQYSKMGTSGVPDRIWFLADRPDLRACKWSVNGGLTYTTLPLTIANYYAYSSHTVWQGDYLKSALVGGYIGAAATLYWHTIGQATWQNKTGNLGIYAPSNVYAIERDSMGSA